MNFKNFTELKRPFPFLKDPCLSLLAHCFSIAMHFYDYIAIYIVKLMAFSTH